MLPKGKLAFNLAALALGMGMLAYASVPLYRIFCSMTGYGGTTQAAVRAPGKMYDRQITVRFNADHAPALPWIFAPVQNDVTVKVGEEKLAFYHAENQEAYEVTGRAVYNVTPHKVGPYFVKTACFCFSEQTLTGRQKVDMPVSFFIDPAMMDDPEMKDVHTITLSYMFFPVQHPALPTKLNLLQAPLNKD